MRLSEAQALGKERRTEIVFRARKTTQRLKSLSDTLGRLSSVMRTEFEDAQANFKAVSKMNALVSIPNELLARIFDYVVNRDDDTESITTQHSRSPTDLVVPKPITTPKRSKVALSLSHVCRHFRTTATSCARLWSNVCRNKELAALCMERTKQVPFNAHILIGRAEQDPHSGFYRLPLDKLLEDILPHSERLGRLEIDFRNSPELDQVDPTNSDVREAFRELYAPALHSLRIRRSPNHYGTGVHVASDYITYHELDGWSAPNLRHFETSHYFPIAFSGLNNLHSLDITLKSQEIDFVNVIRALSQMTVLTDFRLMVTFNASFERMEHIPSFERTCLPSVRRLRIGMIGSGITYLSTESVKLLEALFSPFLFPGVIDLHFIMLFFNYWQQGQPDVSLNRELGWLCQHENQYPCVERLCLEVVDHYREEGRNPGLLMDIPLTKFPNTKELTLCSNARFNPSLQNPQGGDLPTLERITIKAVESGIKSIRPFVASVMKAQNEQEESGSFRELIVVNTRQVTMGDFGMEYPTRIYEGDAALQWCANGTPEMCV